MWTIFENVWHHKIPSVFHGLRIFIALRPMGFRPLILTDHLIQKFQLATHRITPQCEISISMRRDIASRPSS